MKILLTFPEGSRAVELAGPDLSTATVGDLALALRAGGHLPAGAPLDGLLVDGRPVRADHGLAESGLADGAAVAPLASGGTAPFDLAASTTTAVRLGVAGGLQAGRWRDLAPGRHRVGTGRDAVVDHTSLSARHASIDVEASGRVTVHDHASTSGTWVDGRPVDRHRQVGPEALVRTGAVLLRLEPPVHDLPTQRAGARGFNRPPRPAPPRAPAPIALPDLGRTGDRQRPTLPIASVVGGLAMGAVMFAMTGTLAYAALAFLMPVITVMTALGARRRHRRDERRSVVDERAALRTLAEQVEHASDAVAARLRAIQPDVAEVVRRATAPSIRLWERRPGHDDAGHLVIGHTTRAWQPPVTGGAAGTPDEGPAHAVVREHAWLREVPVAAAGGVIGIVGPRSAALAVARSLVVQATVHHGPADLEGVLVTSDPVGWDGAKWLPHLVDRATGRPRAHDPVAGWDALVELVGRRRAAQEQQEADGLPVLLAILDGVETCEGRDAPGRALLRGVAGPVLGIVLAESVDRLPASCDTVVVLEGAEGACRVVRPDRGEVVRGVLASGVDADVLDEVARALARHEDPEATTSADLPSLVGLGELVGESLDDAATVQRRWRRQRLEGRLVVPLGMGPTGPVEIDLDRDGPHALVAGTTGAGKSELLRSLVAGLAVNADPDHVAFVLVDYKGGAAFDRCADLPHVAGLVTDLDDDLAERALVCLRAELHRRELQLREHRVGDLHAYRRLPVAADEPLPDLVVVIDEFATLAAELPDFLDALVGIAQRGRSLGVHLVLATQRPAGVVSDDIRANTNLRISLRVQDRQDSQDVIESAAAAALTRDEPGRAWVRRGPGNLALMQSALVTGPARTAATGLTVRPFGLVATAESVDAPGPTPEDAATELDLLVAAVNDAFARDGLDRPREPWPAPLPERLAHTDLVAEGVHDEAAGADVVALGRADDPEHQRHLRVGWDLGSGSLLVVGGLGSGATSTVASAVVGAADHWTPESLHVHVIDAGRGDLALLAHLPHVSSVVRLGDDERLRRLVARLTAEVERRRRSGDGNARRVLVAIDDWESLASAHDLGPGADLVDDLVRVLVDGPAVGVVCALAVTRAAGVSSRLLAAIPNRWVLRLSDPGEAAMVGVPDATALVPGRAVRADGLRIQVVHPDGLPERVAAIADRFPNAGPGPVRVLPDRVLASALPAARVRDGVLDLPVGPGGPDLAVQWLSLHPGEHALVAGPSRSGRTTALLGMGEVAARAGLDVLHVRARPTAALAAGAEAVDPQELAARAARLEGPALVLLDDADLLDVPDLEAAIRGFAPDVHVVASARADTVRNSYGHWLRSIARSRVGLLLAPDVDLDGDLFGVRLPRHPIAPAAPGRGWLVAHGACAQVQPAAAESSPSELARAS